MRTKTKAKQERVGRYAIALDPIVLARLRLLGDGVFSAGAVRGADALRANRSLRKRAQAAADALRVKPPGEDDLTVRGPGRAPLGKTRKLRAQITLRPSFAEELRALGGGVLSAGVTVAAFAVRVPGGAKAINQIIAARPAKETKGNLSVMLHPAIEATLREFGDGNLSAGAARAAAVLRAAPKLVEKSLVSAQPGRKQKKQGARRRLGRPALGSESKQRVSLTIAAQVAQELRDHGKGNLSAGLERAARAMVETGDILAAAVSSARAKSK